MGPYYIYILECSDRSFYTGFTNDLDRRLVEHQTGFYENAYTSTRRPVKLLYHLQFPKAHEALKFERQLKGWSRAKKIALMNGKFNRLRILSECRNYTHSKYKPDGCS
ncbi:GIY-YIG nuclease family protein [Zobellia nedashkovskayae]|uniref:GIY-YIG nuclease family protein n=1 Tax=Zobellia nedashkovskayae TaxID=2779510 RepID=UPI00188A31FC|nr:GIY-YIG nuclease family protein [Zobellia nedashkovskayae]